MYKLKELPEDFVVEEIFDRKLGDSGKYIICSLKKTNRNTIAVIDEISRKLKTSVGFAGVKDRKAITTQYISVKDTDSFNTKNKMAGKIENLRINNALIKIIGYSNEPISLGDHSGNLFSITIRNLDQEEQNKLKKSLAKTEIKFINFFGEQRFGRANLGVAKAILKRDFKTACSLLDQKEAKEYLERNPTDHLGAIRAVQKNLVNMIINSYQSHLWNLCAEKFSDEKIPTAGFGIEFENPKIEEFYENEMKKDGIKMRDFIIREIPNLSTEGVLRNRIAIAEDVKVVEEENDELFEGRRKVKIEFFLCSGSYATVFIDSLFSHMQ